MAVGFGVAVPKPEPLKRVRGRKTRAESKVKKSVRAQVFERDGMCRANGLAQFYPCSTGAHEWAHLGESKRFRTRGMVPEKRHTTKASCRLCPAHHAQYDRRAAPHLDLVPLTEAGADGPMLAQCGGFSANSSPRW